MVSRTNLFSANFVDGVNEYTRQIYTEPASGVYHAVTHIRKLAKKLAENKLEIDGITHKLGMAIEDATEDIASLKEIEDACDPNYGAYVNILEEMKEMNASVKKFVSKSKRKTSDASNSASMSKQEQVVLDFGPL